MSIKAVLFDLDGTLLPMDQNRFVRAYIKSLLKKVSASGFHRTQFSPALIAGFSAMIKNNGQKTNEKLFWGIFEAKFKKKTHKYAEMFESYYNSDFDKVKLHCGYQPLAKDLIDYLKNKSIRIILATNPLLPKHAAEARLRWAGLDPHDFEYITAYENSSYCKPHTEYYLEILQKLDIGTDECIMVGNDVSEDMIVTELGIRTFLLTDCLINKKNIDISVYPNGSFDTLIKFMKEAIP